MTDDRDRPLPDDRERDRDRGRDGEESDRDRDDERERERDRERPSKSHDPLPGYPRRTRTAEVLDAGTAAVGTLSRLSSNQAIVLMAVVLMGFICISQAFQQWADREERKSTARERLEATATAIRENNAQAELTRQHCAGEGVQLRNYFADQTEKRMKFEADERAKDRASLTAIALELGKNREASAALTMAFEELRKVLAKKNEMP